MTPSNVNAANGVYTYSTDLSQRIAAVSTSIGAIVGAAPKGPVLKPTLITDHEEYKDTFGNGNGKNGFMSQSADPFLDVSKRLYVVRVTNGALTAGAYWTTDDPSSPDPVFSLTNYDDGTNQPLGLDDPENNLGFNPSQPGINNILATFYAIDPGRWNNSIAIGISPANPKEVPLRGTGHDPKHFYVDVYINYTGSSFEQPAERFLCTRHDEIDENGNQLFIEDKINSQSKIIRVKNNSICKDIDVVNSCFEKLDGGSDGTRPTDDQISQAWDLLDDPDEYDINILINAGYATPDIHRKMDTVAKRRGDAIAVLDTPRDKQQTADAITYRVNELNLNSSWSALYSSDVYVTDTQTGKKMLVPVSGFVAAAYAYTDANRGVWFAPAGITRGKLRIEGTYQHYDQGARDAMSENQVNCVRKIPGLGYCLWDQQTLQREASAFQWVAVRRLTNFILKSTSIAATHNVFDPNDETLWNKLTDMVDTFMLPIRRGRGVNAFKTLCDKKTNPPESRANGDVVVHLIFEPTIAVKRIHVGFNINKTGSRATDLSA